MWLKPRNSIMNHIQKVEIYCLIFFLYTHQAYMPNASLFVHQLILHACVSIFWLVQLRKMILLNAIFVLKCLNRFLFVFPMGIVANRLHNDTTSSHRTFNSHRSINLVTQRGSGEQEEKLRALSI